MKYLFGLLLLLPACIQPVPPQYRNTHLDSRMEYRIDAMHGMRYFKNDEIDLCFATVAYDRSLSMATIDCDKVPSDLLFHFRPE